MPQLYLTLEQQASLAIFKMEAKKLSAEDAQKYLIELMGQMMVKDNLINQLMKSSLGIPTESSV